MGDQHGFKTPVLNLKTELLLPDHLADVEQLFRKLPDKSQQSGGQIEYILGNTLGLISFQLHMGDKGCRPCNHIEYEHIDAAYDFAEMKSRELRIAP